MKKYTKCIVAFLDILGFKDIVNTSEYDKVYEILKSIYNKRDIVLALGYAVGTEITDEFDVTMNRYNSLLMKAKIKVMSDSIVIAVPDECPEALAVVINACTIIQENLYECDLPILLRGGISEGDFYADNTFMFGKGLIKAYLAQENCAIYPRIIVSQDLVKNSIAAIDGEKSLLLGNKNILAIDDDLYYFINTLEYYLVNPKDKWSDVIRSEKYKRINQVIEDQLNGYGNERVRNKYIWLRKQLNQIKIRLEDNENS